MEEYVEKCNFMRRRGTEGREKTKEGREKTKGREEAERRRHAGGVNWER